MFKYKEKTKGLFKAIKNFSYTLMLFFVLLILLTAGSRAEEFTDMMGRKVELPDKIESVVTTYKSATQFVLSLGAEDKITAVSIKTDKQKLFVELEPRLADLPQVGSKRNGINIETTAEVDPDLVILYPHRDAVETAEKLEELGIGTIIINPESLELIRETTLLLGDILDKEEQAEAVISAYNKIDNLSKRTAELEEKNRKKIYFANSEFSDSVGKNMMQTALIEKAGGINPAAQLKSGFVSVSTENIIEWNPDLIVVSQYFSEDLENIKSDPKYQSLNAVKNDEVHRFPSALEPWDFPSPSSYIAQLWLAVKAYPEIYQDLDYQKEVNQFYNTLYGKSFEELGGSFE
jgi:iron complex transport system substrate-binding protein